MNTSVVLTDPKYPHNVGNALRACSAMGAQNLFWTGDRVERPADWPKGARLPREERMELYRNVNLQWLSDDFDLTRLGDTPVCVEVSDQAESLFDFIHPDDAIYIFGPEDGFVTKGIRTICHRFVRIPSKSCLNLAAAVSVVLYDRSMKRSHRQRNQAWYQALNPSTPESLPSS